MNDIKFGVKLVGLGDMLVGLGDDSDDNILVKAFESCEVDTSAS